ncbi:MAG: PilZ domain-containing protein [Pseudomonadota bacterium]
MMSVERRYSKRYAVHCDVYIRYRRQRAFPASAENCSLYGMYLKTDNLTLLSGALVELDIFYNNQNWQITGLVTHAGKNGLGVMFWKEQPEFYKTVAENAMSVQDERIEELIALPVRAPYAEESAQ